MVVDAGLVLGWWRWVGRWAWRHPNEVRREGLVAIAQAVAADLIARGQALRVRPKAERVAGEGSVHRWDDWMPKAWLSG